MSEFGKKCIEFIKTGFEIACVIALCVGIIWGLNFFVVDRLSEINDREMYEYGRLDGYHGRPLNESLQRYRDQYNWCRGYYDGQEARKREGKQ